MIFLDDDYKIDCENKIKYDHLAQVSTNDIMIRDHIFNATKVLCDGDPQNPIYLVTGGEHFYTVDVKFCKEIGPNLYKVSLNPYVASKSAANNQRRTLS